MARVLYVSQYFVSGDQPGGVRHWQHCRALARAGHDVTVVTSYVQHKERTIPEEYRGRRIVRSRVGGGQSIVMRSRRSHPARSGPSRAVASSSTTTAAPAAHASHISSTLES